MKLLKWSLVTAALITSASAFAVEGTDRGNGGDEYAKLFINQGADIAEALTQNPIPGVDARELMQAVQNTFVNSQERLFLRGDEVDAINYPDARKILVSRTGWDRMSSSPHRRAFLVLHEYLGIIGIDDARYQVSSLLDRAGVCARPYFIRLAIERDLRKSCYRIIQDDLNYVTSLWLRSISVGRFSLRKEDLRSLPSLKGIDFSYDSLDSINPNAFEFAPLITNLSFDNALRNLDDCRFFAKLPELTEVNFGYVRSPRYGEAFYFSSIDSGCFAQNSKLRSLQILVDAKNIYQKDFFAGLKGDIDLRVNLHFKNTNSIDASILTPLNGVVNDLRIYSDDIENIDVPTIVRIWDQLPSFKCEMSSNPNNYAFHLIECKRK